MTKALQPMTDDEVSQARASTTEAGFGTLTTEAAEPCRSRRWTSTRASTV